MGGEGDRHGRRKGGAKMWKGVEEVGGKGDRHGRRMGGAKMCEGLEEVGAKGDRHGGRTRRGGVWRGQTLEEERRGEGADMGEGGKGGTDIRGRGGGSG